MLVLSRSEQEVVQVGTGETAGFVRVLSIERGKVRLGFEFPSDVAVHRVEIAQRIETKNGKAATQSYPLLPRSDGIMGDSRDYV